MPEHYQSSEFLKRFGEKSEATLTELLGFSSWSLDGAGAYLTLSPMGPLWPKVLLRPGGHFLRGGENGE